MTPADRRKLMNRRYLLGKKLDATEVAERKAKLRVLGLREQCRRLLAKLSAIDEQLEGASIVRAG